MQIRNTEQVEGMVVFSGHDTKVMMNSAPPIMKFSKLDKSTNNTIKIVLGIQIFMAIIGGITGSIMISSEYEM